MKIYTDCNGTEWTEMDDGSVFLDGELMLCDNVRSEILSSTGEYHVSVREEQE